MKPTSPLEVELVFLRDIEARLAHLQTRLREGYSGMPEVLGLQSVLNTRLATVTQQRDKENANAEIQKQAKADNSQSVA